MTWSEIRSHYPHQWLLVEAIQAHSRSRAGKRIVEQLAVMQTFSDPLTAMESYKHLHRAHPGREWYVVHTDKEALDITERKWLGIRGTV